MNQPHRNDTLYKLDVSFPEVHGKRLEFSDGAGGTTQSPPSATFFPNPFHNIRLVPASEMVPPPAQPATHKVKGSVQFASPDIKVDYIFYSNQSVDQPVRMRREIYDKDHGFLLYYLEICEEGLEGMGDIPRRTVRCQINGKKDVIKRSKKDKQRREEMELAGYGHFGGIEVEEDDMARAIPINREMMDELARLREELKELRLLTPAELKMARKTAENTKMNTGALKTFEQMFELRTPGMGNKGRHLTRSPPIPLPYNTLGGASDKNPREDQKKRAGISDTGNRMPGDPLRMPDDDAQGTDTEPDTAKEKPTPKPAGRGIPADKPLQWDQYLEATGRKSNAAHKKGRALGGSYWTLLHPFFSSKKEKIKALL